MARTRENCQGFSLIEVLVTLVLLNVGILGMLTLQGKSIQYTQHAVNRNLAVTLANELSGIMRAHRDEFFNNKPPQAQAYTQLKSSTALYDSDGTLKLNAQSCPAASLPQSASEQAHCWLKAVEASLPGSQDPEIKSAFKLCPSFKIGQCAGSDYHGASLELQLAWRVKPGECMDDLESSLCTYSTWIEL